jgi:hypothetical protein
MAAYHVSDAEGSANCGFLVLESHASKLAIAVASMTACGFARSIIRFYNITAHRSLDAVHYSPIVSLSFFAPIQS